MHLPLLWVPLENFADAVGDQPLEENGYAMWDVGNADISLEPSAGSLQFYEPQIATGAVPDAQSAGHFTWVADMETVLGKGRGSIADRHLSRGGDIASTFEVQAGCVSAGWECDRYGEQQKWDFGNRKQKAIADSIVVEMPVPADSPPKIRFRNTTINLKFDGGARTFEIVVGSIPVPRTGMPDPKKMPHYVHFWQFLKNRANFPEPVSQQDPACKAPDALATSVAIGGVTYPLGPNVARCAPIVFTYP